MAEKSEKTQAQLFELEDAPTEWERAAEEDVLSVEVVLDRPLVDSYTYLVPDRLRDLVAAGMRARVPFGRGNQTETGFIVSVGRPPKTGRRLKTILDTLDREPLVNQRMLRLTRWIAEHYLCGWGQVLQSVIPAGVKRNAGTRELTYFRTTEAGRKAFEALSLPRKQHQVMQVLIDAPEPMRGEAIAEAADCGSGPIQTLRKKELIEAVRRREEVAAHELEPVIAEEDFVPNSEQQRALDLIHATIRGGTHRTLLLHRNVAD